MYQSSRFKDKKEKLFQKIKNIFFHISTVHVRTGVYAYMDSTLLNLNIMLIFNIYAMYVILYCFSLFHYHFFKLSLLIARFRK